MKKKPIKKLLQSGFFKIPPLSNSSNSYDSIVIDHSKVIRKEVVWFAEQMEARLKENDHKKGWQDCDFLYLQLRLRREYNELRREIMTTEKKDVDKIISECADIANFCMMIANNFKNGRYE